MRRASHIFGLTGGLASGKTTVARMFAALGARIIEADRLGHELLGAASPAYHEVLAQFGADILDPSEEINRARLAALVFAEPSRLAALNAILHPRILNRIDEIAAQYRAVEPAAVILVEAALIYEAGVEDRFAKIIVAWCRPEQQRERLLARQTVPPDQIEPRLAAQMSLDEKRRRADYVVDCSGNLESTQAQVAALYGELQRFTAA
jgi:dephospho-CoA kinase